MAGYTAHNTDPKHTHASVPAAGRRRRRVGGWVISGEGGGGDDAGGGAQPGAGQSHSLSKSEVVGIYRMRST